MRKWRSDGLGAGGVVMVASPLHIWRGSVCFVRRISLLGSGFSLRDFEHAHWSKPTKQPAVELVRKLYPGSIAVVVYFSYVYLYNPTIKRYSCKLNNYLTRYLYVARRLQNHSYTILYVLVLYPVLREKREVCIIIYSD